MNVLFLLKKCTHLYSYSNIRCGLTHYSIYNMKVYQYIRANGGYRKFDLIQVERVEYDTRHELHARERRFDELLIYNLNINIPKRAVCSRILT